MLQQGQGWKPPQIKDLKLIIPEDYTFMPDKTDHTRRLHFHD